MNILEKNGKRYLNFLGIFLFLYILSRINFSDFFNKLPQINLWLILLLPPLIIIINLIKAWRWRIMLSRQNINYPFTQIILIYLSGIFFGAITPGRIGELGRLYYLKKDQHSTFNSLTTLILDKVLDLILALILGVAGLFIYSRYLHINQTYISVFIVLLILFLLFNHHAPRLVPSLNKKIAEYKLRLKNGFKNYRPIDYFLIFLTTIISWLIYLATAYIATLSVGINNISIWYAGAVMNLTTLISLLPISIMGIGTRESLFIFFYYLKNQPQEIALTVSIIVFLSNIFSIFLGFISWIAIKYQKPKLPLPSSSIEAYDVEAHTRPVNKL